MKKETLQTVPGREKYFRPVCKLYSIKIESNLCAASIGDVDPGGGMDDYDNDWYEENEDYNLWN